MRARAFAGLLASTVALLAACGGPSTPFRASAGGNPSAPAAPSIPPPSASAPQASALIATSFVVPFTYARPSGETARLQAVGVARPAVIYSRQQGFSDRLFVFLVTPYLHACSTVTDDPTNEMLRVGTEPSTFLRSLRDTAEVGLGPISPARLGNLPAVAVEVDPSRSTCGRYAFHENGLGLGAASLEPTLDNPGRLIVARIGNRSIGVLISSATETGLASWLPIAEAYVDSFVFEDVRG